LSTTKSSETKQAKWQQRNFWRASRKTTLTPTLTLTPIPTRTATVTTTMTRKRKMTKKKRMLAAGEELIWQPWTSRSRATPLRLWFVILRRECLVNQTSPLMCRSWMLGWTACLWSSSAMSLSKSLEGSTCLVLCSLTTPRSAPSENSLLAR